MAVCLENRAADPIRVILEASGIFIHPSSHHECDDQFRHKADITSPLSEDELRKKRFSPYSQLAPTLEKRSKIESVFPWLVLGNLPSFGGGSQKRFHSSHMNMN